MEFSIFNKTKTDKISEGMIRDGMKESLLLDIWAKILQSSETSRHQRRKNVSLSTPLCDC